MMAITRTRTDPLATHNPAHGPLALQAPGVAQPDVFVSTVPSKAGDKMNNNSPRKAAAPVVERIASSKLALVDSKRAVAGNGEPRAALARVNLNVGTLQKRLQTAVARPHAKSIPQPAAVPDVFDTEPPRNASALGKRPRERSAPATSSKRARAEAAALAAKSHKHEQEQWLAKWQKVFPTLVFHFEIGAEEGVVGRNLNNRVQQMGAVSGGEVGCGGARTDASTARGPVLLTARVAPCGQGRRVTTQAPCCTVAIKARCARGCGYEPVLGLDGRDGSSTEG